MTQDTGKKGEEEEEGEKERSQGIIREKCGKIWKGRDEEWQQESGSES